MTVRLLLLKYFIKCAITLVLLLFSIMLTSHNAESGECDTAITTQDMRVCLGAKHSTANEELSKLHTRIEKLLTQEHREVLAKAHAAWLSYRDANCASAASLYQGGTMEPLVLLNCRFRMTQERIQELRLIYEEVLRMPTP